MLKMGRSMLPIIILTTVALSSSDVLPNLSNKHNTEPFDINYQKIDNIFSNRYQDSNIPNIFYNRALRDSYISLPKLKENTEAMYAGKDKNQYVKIFNDVVKKNENYDDEGYRQEQWHNYPRQLDRLHNYKQRYDKSNETPESDSDDTEAMNSNLDDFTGNELSQDSSDGDRNVYDTLVAAANPFLVLKVQLTYLREDMKKNDLNEYSYLLSLPYENNPERNDEDIKSLSKKIESAANTAKVKRAKSFKIRNNELSNENSFASGLGNSSDNKKTVKKRLFSLWSRLQSLSHRGHELHHRRHLHAFYGSPANNGNGIVTAQTRATFIRPPGSPLRWG